MAISNAKIADLLRRYARTHELERADRFKIKAYKRAADTLETLDADISKLVARGEDLTELPNIGNPIEESSPQISQL